MWNIPNIMTVGRLAFLPVIVWMIAPGVETRETALWAGLIYGFAGALDMVDGAIARRLNQVTVLGQFLDPLADKLYLLVTLIALMALPGERIPAWVVMVIIAREVSITGLRAIAASEGIVIAAGEGGKMKTVFSTLGTSGLIIHYPYYVNLGFISSVVSIHNIGLLITYASVAISVTSGLGYATGFFRALSERHQAPTS